MIAGDVSRWPLAGDQIYADFDIGVEHLPPGTRLTIGDAEIEVSEKPHTGCAKFSARFGADALRFVNSPEGRRLRLRGMNTRITRAEPSAWAIRSRCAGYLLRTCGAVRTSPG